MGSWFCDRRLRLRESCHVGFGNLRKIVGKLKKCRPNATHKNIGLDPPTLCQLETGTSSLRDRLSLGDARERTETVSNW